MKFTTVLLLALPAVSLAQTAPPTPTPTGNLTVCKQQAGPYAQFCARCEPQCNGRTGTAYSQCLYSVFSDINYIESLCEAHNGNNCENQSVDDVCGPA
ncbi:hypothetical protein BGW36DRAFT_431261 [Talaromyces proteolyticus]|uniref:Extracellular membrane protein CFEM domain-containing protein n=1 Tax=Talaromyces proteolyticus TaxID=1131652 RepID=A0AAD4KHQ8_9EURO|nr:uncharacterized protein BGW36DRAFT_431261 [Talaromyces proteolyticus]KAH8692025.1 hypothetical protein BGW36DRAFT_431261 [Talaromyces proteolyticus]